MGYYTRITGELEIEPPITRPEFEGSDFTDPRSGSSVWLELNEDEDSFDRVVTYEDAVKAYYFEVDLQRLVDAFPGHKFDGIFEGEGEENRDIWEVRVRNGRVQRRAPDIVWPEWPTDT